MQVTLKKGLILFSFFYLLSLSIGVSLAYADGNDGSVKKDTDDQEVSDPQAESDSTDIPEQVQPYDIQAEINTMNLESEQEDVDSDLLEVPASDSYYDSEDEDTDDSQSIISFNFLYYLFQKFKFSNSLGY